MCVGVLGIKKTWFAQLCEFWWNVCDLWCFPFFLLLLNDLSGHSVWGAIVCFISWWKRKKAFLIFCLLNSWLNHKQASSAFTLQAKGKHAWPTSCLNHKCVGVKVMMWDTAQTKANLKLAKVDLHVQLIASSETRLAYLDDKCLWNCKCLRTSNGFFKMPAKRDFTRWFNALSMNLNLKKDSKHCLCK